MIERWLFFADAGHVSMLYYGADVGDGHEEGRTDDANDNSAGLHANIRPCEYLSNRSFREE